MSPNKFGSMGLNTGSGESPPQSLTFFRWMDLFQWVPPEGRFPKAVRSAVAYFLNKTGLKLTTKIGPINSKKHCQSKQILGSSFGPFLIPDRAHGFQNVTPSAKKKLGPLGGHSPDPIL